MPWYQTHIGQKRQTTHTPITYGHIRPPNLRHSLCKLSHHHLICCFRNPSHRAMNLFQRTASAPSSSPSSRLYIELKKNIYNIYSEWTHIWYQTNALIKNRLFIQPTVCVVVVRCVEHLQSVWGDAFSVYTLEDWYMWIAKHRTNIAIHWNAGIIHGMAFSPSSNSCVFDLSRYAMRIRTADWPCATLRLFLVWDVWCWWPWCTHSTDRIHNLMISIHYKFNMEYFKVY